MQKNIQNPYTGNWHNNLIPEMFEKNIELEVKNSKNQKGS